ncbi:chromate efflux transporter [Acidisoma cellulosilytica]|uniref:Chromate efflux transporter n=1 Tax=Acidisoma cellulosilyticum TaxID=2802395 RepID=A0A963YZ28_9PROT|nr:chromate efflux transporter [Acidisoma cellulosilyticum]MCB8879042.1 chromate efflux transporter [Acidisoma cellulosilyticum]
MSDPSPLPPGPKGPGTAAEVFQVFLGLGLSAFGGPIAHLGYFRDELVRRRRWIDEESYGDLVSLCQFLPGPASSQVGFALGLLRAGGLAGGIAAWAGFTLPSAVLLVLFALAARDLHGAVALGLLHGLKLVAVAVVAQAVWGMARSLAPDKARAAIALVALALTLMAGGLASPLACIALGAALGLRLDRKSPADDAGRLTFPVSPRTGAMALLLCAILFLLSLMPADTTRTAWSVFRVFFHAGALVFGGGHVVLPLLQQALVPRGWITDQDFLAGYGLAQAVPGPLFTFAAYLGAMIAPGGQAIAGAAVALAGLFLPGMLLVLGMLPFWDKLRRRPYARNAMAGANAAVVGVLGAALYNPVWTSAVIKPSDFVLATLGFLLLTLWQIAPWRLVLVLAVLGAAQGWIPNL